MLGSAAGRLATALDLITFFTAGEKETRAWTLTRGSTALDAASNGEVTVISDANVRVARSYLWSLVNELERRGDGGGLVTSVVAGTGERTLGAALENLQLGALVGDPGRADPLAVKLRHARDVRLAQRDDRGERALDDVIVRAWEELTAHRGVACPVCGGEAIHRRQSVSFASASASRSSTASSTSPGLKTRCVRTSTSERAA